MTDMKDRQMAIQSQAARVPHTHTHTTEANEKPQSKVIFSKLKDNQKLVFLKYTYKLGN